MPRVMSTFVKPMLNPSWTLAFSTQSVEPDSTLRHQEIGHPETGELLYYLLDTKQSPKRICKQKMRFRHPQLQHPTRVLRNFVSDLSGCCCRRRRPHVGNALVLHQHMHTGCDFHLAIHAYHIAILQQQSPASFPFPHSRLLQILHLQTSSHSWRNSAPLSHKTLQKP